MLNFKNLASYDNVEKLQLSFDEERLKEYCNLKMETAKENADFIQEHLYRNKKISVCEIGCGNGKLLFELKKRGIVDYAVGYEVSNTRCKMAEKFQEILFGGGNKEDKYKILIHNQNFLESNKNEKKFDVIIMVDIVLQIISPLYEEAFDDTIKWLKQNLNECGIVFLEIADYSDELHRISEKNKIITEWQEFPEGDPYKYMLSKMDMDADNNLIYNKTFINRKGGEETFTNIIKSYTRLEIEKLLKENGFYVDIFDIQENRFEFRILAKLNI